jgi:Repeat of unknown function (DUF5907)
MKQGRIAGLKNKYLSPAFLLILILFSSILYGQTYDPTKATVSNKPYGSAQAFPTDARSYFYDATNFVWRPYQSTAEVNSFLNLPKYRTGQFIIVVDSGGLLQPNGVFIGGHNTFWIYKDSTANSNLVELNLFGSSGCVGCLLSANNLSDLANAGTARNNLGLGLMATQSTTASSTDVSGVWPSGLTVNSVQGKNLAYLTNYLNLSNTPAIPPQLNPTQLGQMVITGTYPNLSFNSVVPGFEQTLLKLNTTSQADSIVIGSNIFSIFGTSAIVLPSGTTAQRPGTPAPGMIRYNYDSAAFEYYSSAWHTFGSGGGGGSGGITALTGDGTASGTGSVPFTLATVNSNVFGSNTFLKVAVNGKGLTTSAVAVGLADITAAQGFQSYPNTNPNNYIPATFLSNTSPITYNSGTGVFGLDTTTAAGGWHSYDFYQTKFLAGNQAITLSGDVAGSGTTAITTTIQANAVTTSKINNAAVTYAKIQNTAGGSVLLGAQTAGTLSEITLGTNLSMTGGVLNATTAGAQTLTYTQNATNNNLAISGGNSQNFLPATSLLAGLLDTARAKYVDSARLRLITQNLYTHNGIGTTGTDSIQFGLNPLDQNTNLNTAGFAFLITNLPNKSTPLSTDSALMETAGGQLYKIPITTGGLNQLTGDVTAGPGSGSQVATISALAVTTGKIAANAVTLGKMSTNVSNSLLGYDGSGNPNNTTIGTGLSLVGGVLSNSSTGTIGGSIAATQVAFGSGSNTINGVPGFTYNNSANALNVYNVISTRHQFLYDTTRTSGVTSTMTGLGDSYTVGVGAVPTSEAYFFILDSAYQYLPYADLGVSGSGAWMATNKSYLNIQPGNQSLTTWMAGFNNARVNGGGASILTTRDITNGLNAVICNQFNSAVVNAWNGIGITLTGSITQYNGTSFGGKSLTNAATSAAAGDTIAYAFTGNNVFVAGFGADSSSSPFFFSEAIQFIIDGTSVLTASEDNQASGIDPSGDSYNNRIVPMTWHFTGLTQGSHVIKVVNKTTHSYPMNIDYFGVFVDPKSAMPIVVFEIPKMNATGYAISGFTSASNAVMNALNVSIDSTVALYPTNYPIFVVKTNNFFNTSTDVSGDNIHPNNQGHFHIMQGALAVLPTSNTFGVAYGSLPPGTIDYSGYKHVFSDSSGLQVMATQAGLARGKYNLGAPGYYTDFLYNKSGSIAAWSKMYADTVNHSLTLNMTPVTAGNQTPLTGLILTDTTTAITSQFRNSPTLTLSSNDWNSGTSASQSMSYYLWVQGHTGNPINGYMNLTYQVGSGSVLPAWTYVPGVGMGINIGQTGISGALDVYQPSAATYGTLTRNNAGSSFVDVGVTSAPLGFMGFDATLSGIGVTFNAAGNFVFNGTGASTLNSGNTSQRPGSPTAGMLRYNTDSSKYEFYNTAWNTIGSGSGGGSSYTFSNSIVNTAGTVTLVNDNATPGNSKYYGTNGSGTLGYFALGSATPGGDNYSLQYNVNGSLTGNTVLQWDTAGLGLDIISTGLGSTLVEGSGLFLNNTTAAATNGFQVSPSLAMKGTWYDQTSATSKYFIADQYLITKSTTTANAGASIQWIFKNNSTTPINGMALVYSAATATNTSLVINGNASNAAGVIDAYQVASAPYGSLTRISGGGHFTDIGMENTTTAVLGMDNTLTSTSAANFDGSGNFRFPGHVSGGTQTDAGKGWLQAALNNTTIASIYLAPSSTVNVTSPSSGQMWWNGTNLYFYNGSANVDLLAGSSGVNAVGTFSGSSIANGASIAANTITFGPADPANPGMVTTGTQTMAGLKTFTGTNTKVYGIQSNSGTPGNSLGVGSGTGGSLTIAGGDIGGSLTLTTGTLPTASATVVTITNSAASFTNGEAVTLTPGNAATALLSGATMVFVTGNTGGFVISSGTTGLTAATTYKWYYTVIGY